MNVAWLSERLREAGPQTALVWRDTAVSYAQLLAEKDTWRAELTRRGLGAGSVVLLYANASPGACALLLALIEAGAVAVPLTPQFAHHRGRFEEIAEVNAAFEFDDHDAWRFVARSNQTATNPLLRTLASRGAPGLVIFSSGSTGEPKAVLHDFEALLGKFKKAGQKKTTLSFLLFDHIGGIDTLFNTWTAGGTVVTVPSRDPATVARTIERWRVHTLPASPTFLNLLLASHVWETTDLRSLQVIAWGTEPMPQTTMERLKAVFPHAKLVQTFGMSELGVLRARPKDESSSWLRFSNEGFQTQVRDGTLWVKSPTAMLGYLNAPDLFDGDGWLNTQDAVETDGEFIRIVGRVTDLINVGGQKVYPAEVEGVVLSLDNVKDVSVFGEKSPLTGQFVAARVQLQSPEDPAAFKKRLIAHCKKALPAYKVPLKVELVNDELHSERFKKVRKR